MHTYLSLYIFNAQHLDICCHWKGDTYIQKDWLKKTIFTVTQKHTSCTYTKYHSFEHTEWPHLCLNYKELYGHHRWLHNQFPPFFCSPLPSGTWQTLGLSTPCCCLPTSFSVCLIFFTLSLCFSRWFWPDLMNRRHVHTTAVCVSLWWSGGLHVMRLLAESWHRRPRW